MFPRDRRFAGIVVALAAAVAVLAGANAVLAPVPVGAALATGFGLGAWFLAPRRRTAWTVAGAAAGVATGVLWHRGVHDAGGSPAPVEGLAAHLATDGGVSLLVASLALGVAAALARVATRRPHRGSKHGA